MLITLATTNLNKLNELAACANASGCNLSFALPDENTDVEETGSTFEENAAIKARSVQPVKGSGYVLGEDSGLVVDALAGLYGIDPFPGLYSNRWLTSARYLEIAGEEIPEKELAFIHKNTALQVLLSGKANRCASYVCAMALRNAQSNEIITVRGTTPLEIIEGPGRGEGGFGYDPIALACDWDNNRTMAELTPEEKNAISHRGRAFQALLSCMSPG